MAMTNAERQRRFRDRHRSLDEQRATVLTELFEIAVGRRSANPSKMRAIELWLGLYEAAHTPGAIGKKALAYLRAQDPPDPDSPWADLLN